MPECDEGAVSVIIPARNEEMNIERVVRSLAPQQHVREIIVVDDESTDRTDEILAGLRDEIPLLRTLRLESLPEGWTGKSHAAAAGAETATGKWLLFTDADTEHLEGSLAAAVAEAKKHKADLLSYSPEQLLTGVRQRLLMPLIFAARAVRYSPRRINDPAQPDAAANGHYLLARATALHNVELPLVYSGVPAEMRREKAVTALRAVEMEDRASHRPNELSGGQRQRVAIARALVIEPEVLLLDEPLSNLDAHLRVEMRGEIRQLQKSLGITAIYVTHDQEEALAISDRIAVMRAGGIEPIDGPDGIYRDPLTPFVGEFMGISSLLSGTVARRGGSHLVGGVGASEFVIEADQPEPGETITFCLRPEALRVVAAEGSLPEGWASLLTRIARVEFLGTLMRLEVELAGGPMLRVALLDQSHEALSVGRELTLAYDPQRATPLKSS